MPVNERDFALLVEEVKCLRGKFNQSVSTAGGYTDQLTSPGSSVYPDGFYNCECYEVQEIQPDPLTFCNPDTINAPPLGDFGNDTAVTNNPLQSLFIFDAILGVRYLDPVEGNYENRNVGLQNNFLEHGCVDSWWYRKTTPIADNMILWRVGLADVRRSNNAGRTYWEPRLPEPPTGYSLSNIRFTQIVSDTFRQNHFLMLARTETAPWKTWLVNTTNDGQVWNWTELTNYNGKVQRWPIWMAISGGTGSLVWVSCWADDKLVLMKINNDPSPTISAEYEINDATLWEVINRFETLSPATQVDSGRTWFYGRATTDDFGISHIIKTDNEGLSFELVEQSYGFDWVGSMKLSLADGSGNRNIYLTRNER